MHGMEAGKLRFSPHVDLSTLSLLIQDSLGGLEVCHFAMSSRQCVPLPKMRFQMPLTGNRVLLERFYLRMANGPWCLPSLDRYWLTAASFWRSGAAESFQRLSIVLWYRKCANLH